MFCPNCGNKLENENSPCIFCGQASSTIDNATLENEEVPKKIPSKKRAIVSNTEPSSTLKRTRIKENSTSNQDSKENSSNRQHSTSSNRTFNSDEFSSFSVDLKKIITSIINNPLNGPSELIGNLSKNTPILILALAGFLILFKGIIFSFSFSYRLRFNFEGFISSVLTSGISLALAIGVLYLLLDKQKKFDLSFTGTLEFFSISYLPVLALGMFSTILSFFRNFVYILNLPILLAKPFTMVIGILNSFSICIFAIILFNLIRNHNLVENKKVLLATLIVGIFI